MNHVTKRAPLGLLALAASVCLTLAGTTPAQAATYSKKCEGSGNCVVTKTHPRKGTVVVKVNISNGNSGDRFGWDIRHNGKIICWGDVREQWSTKKFTCKNMPKGELKLTQSHNRTAVISMGW